MTGKREKKRTQAKRIGILPVFHIDADAFGNGMTVTVSGIVGVTEFSDGEIRLITSRVRLIIKGSSINLRIFEGNTVEISGNVLSIERGGERVRRYGDAQK